MLLRIVCLLVLCVLAPAVHAQSIAFTFDDGLDPRKEPRAAELNAKILEALRTRRVQALLLPAGRNVDSPEGMALVRDWGTAGHWIGNHTYAHRNLAAAAVTHGEFIVDIEKAERLLSPLRGWRRLFRYPYLKEGATAEERDAVRAWLRGRGYRQAPVSIDTSDWYFSQRFDAWRTDHPGADTAAYRSAYLDHLWDRAQAYDRLSRSLTGRSAPHVILLHTNAINAEFIGEAIDMFRAKGWKVVRPGRALRDRVYAPVDTLPAGESVLWALARKAGDATLRYPAEDARYEKAALDALEAGLRRTDP